YHKGGDVMEESPLTIEEFNDQLQQWSGQKIRIVKEEMDDLDETMLVLDDVSYAKGSSIDDYIPKYALLLKGNGVVEKTMNHYEELHSEEFEIPLGEDTIYEFDGKRFFIRNSRGIYTIEQYDW